MLDSVTARRGERITQSKDKEEDSCDCWADIEVIFQSRGQNWINKSVLQQTNKDADIREEGQMRFDDFEISRRVLSFVFVDLRNWFALDGDIPHLFVKEQSDKHDKRKDPSKGPERQCETAN